MPKRAISFILGAGPIAALALTACATREARPDLGAERLIANTERSSDRVEAATTGLILEEFRTVARNCELPGAALTRAGEGYSLHLSADVHAARDRQPAAGRIACIMRWARDADFILTLAEAPY